MEQIEAIDREPDFERPLDPRRTRPARRNLVWPIVMIAAVVAAGVLVWRTMRAPLPVTGQPPQVEAPAAPVPPVAPAAGTPQHPIEASGAAPAQTPPLPAVDDSDSALRDAMAALFTAVRLDRVFHLQQIVRRFVATIDNLPRQTVALDRMPVLPVEGSLATASADGRLLLRADNETRYATYMRVMEAADTHRLVEAYVRFYPLFQKAYEELGYPHGYFNDRLVEVIDHLLGAPDVPAPIELTQPKVLYEFADPALEAQSAGRKILMRIGPVDESRVKAKLREIRAALTGQALPR